MITYDYISYINIWLYIIVLSYLEPLWDILGIYFGALYVKLQILWAAALYLLV